MISFREPLLADWCRERMAESPVVLEAQQREVVKGVIREHCELRSWTLHAANCRSNHCHVVVTAVTHEGEQVRDQLKSWAKRRLKDGQRATLSEGEELREHWWTRKGSVRKLSDEESLEAAVIYTLESQDIGGSKANE